MMMGSCYNQALKILARREHSRLELTRKLSTKDFEINEINQAIDKLILQKYQNNSRFAFEFVQMKYNQGKGKILIRANLQEHGIDDFDFTNFDFLKLCKKVKINKFGEDIPQDFKEKTKQMRFLQSRGFDFNEINNVIK